MGKTVIPPALPEGVRLVVPVMAATGGSGRSAVASLLANALADSGTTVVLDTGPRMSSPWPVWSAGLGSDGLSALPPDRPLSRGRVHRAAAVRPSTVGRRPWQVLTDSREWHAPPLGLPSAPAAWYQLGAVGGWQSVIADTHHPVSHDILTARCTGRAGHTSGWCGLPYAVPVLCAAATSDGVQALQQSVMALHSEGLPLERTVVVLVATADSRTPAVVRAARTMLAPRTAAMVGLPHDPHIRAHGLKSLAPLHSRTHQAGARLAAAVLTAAYAAWGDPLPQAPRPAPLPAAAPALRGTRS
ncbi:hypothetical protein [Streptomyces sp. NPDC050428]|uniref:hypothetical protein n=1 Tax=Streptomyces sp. NPDC050428 TaxID=3155757 RepID=UPI00341BF707